LILTKCAASRRPEVRVIFERESFGELERLVTQKLLDTAKTIAKDELREEERLRIFADLMGRSPDEICEESPKFLESEPVHMSEEICASFLGPLIDSWDIDLKTFRIDIVLNRKLARGGRKRFEFVETEPERPVALEPGFQEFLANASLSGDATEEELAFLKKLKFNGRRPTRIYYYRELQNIRDPLHFGEPLPLRSSTQKKG
jgi:hypothetical protein